MKIKKILKDIAIFILMAFIITNVISYIKKPNLESEQFPALHAKLLNGGSFDYKEFQGKPFIIHFWATWCPVCKVEIANFERLKKRGYQILTIAVQSGSDEEIKEFMKDKDLTFRVINDKSGNLAKHFKIKGYPTTFIYDKEGRLFFVDSGYTSDLSLMLKLYLAK
jgi:thiol-disulfide isomerase/thioredoxin